MMRLSRECFLKESFLITLVLLHPKNPVTSFQITMNPFRIYKIELVHRIDGKVSGRTTVKSTSDF
ncbi:hypothetical protein SOMG_04056 [Schizosaccharomyces osmophilus]|uniref:Uncharacterized protein n=1 Tax=Schizosaccharomyces osmophilus TaxID=2545709 RepID=A0AAE9WCV6_9SCHI|nr:uncharacterized protein SOMG_04056 [Schizosaccharomyces osmophilus]WBW73919.1 hypothetical protein SOMG_04056 [Schizosaccharomyces osmophilus]